MGVALSGCAAQPVTTATSPAPQPVSVPPVEGDWAVRVARLEQNVEGLESDVAVLQTEVTQVRPKLAKVDAMERHFRQLSLELDRINETYDIGMVKNEIRTDPSPVAVTEPVRKISPVKVEPAKVETRPQTKPQPQSQLSGPLKVNQVRIGEQPGGRTRIVLDASAPAKVNYDVDNAEKLLVIEVPGALWGAQRTAVLKSSPLVASYQAESDSSGSRLIVQLKDEAKVVGVSRLSPAHGAGHRVFLDLGKK